MYVFLCCCFVLVNDKWADGVRLSYWSSDVCSSDLAGPRCQVPGHDVEVGPAGGRTDEALEEERSDDCARIGAAGDVVEIRHLAVEALPVRLVQRQAPDGTALGPALAQDDARQRVVAAETARPFQDAVAPGRAGQGSAVDQKVRILVTREERRGGTLGVLACCLRWAADH